MKKSIGISPNIETLFGTRDENMRLLEDGLNISIDLRSNSVELEGAARDVARAEQVFSDYEALQRSGYTFNNGDLNSMLRVLICGFDRDPARVGRCWPAAFARHAAPCNRRVRTSAVMLRPSKNMTWFSASALRELERHISPSPWRFRRCLQNA